MDFGQNLCLFTVNYCSSKKHVILH